MTLGPTARTVLRAPALLHRWNLGWLLGRRFVLLTHVGRRSGRRYETVLEVIARRPEDDEFMVLAALGHSAQWYRNIQAGPAVELAVGRRGFQPTHRTLSEDEAVAVLADYQRRAPAEAPIVRRVLSRLVGWHYDGTEVARRRLASELPIVVFRPATFSDA